MNHNSENIPDRIRKIRKAKQRSIHDCASLLEVSKEHYLRFENGTAPFTLPDLELLAQFFDVPLTAFFNDSPLESYSLSLPTDTLKPQYIQLRHKMIRAKFNQLREQTGVTLDELQKETEIPKEDLLDFDDGNAPIPISSLIKIINCLGVSLDQFFKQDDQPINEITGVHSEATPKWRPEYPEGESGRVKKDRERYEQLVSALKQISKEDQARIAKLLLGHLKSLQ